MDPVILFSQLPAGATAPDWVHLVPAGEFRGVDGRGPFVLRDAAQVIRNSLAATGGRLPIDENHSIDRLAPKGEPSPARGWIVELQSRDDGIWGKVEWTVTGAALVADRAYRGLSPALTRRPDGNEVTGVLRASLTNIPNLSSLTTLHDRSEDMDFLARARQALGLGADVAEADVLTAIAAQKTVIDTHSTQLAGIRKAAGLADNLAPDAMVIELQTRQSAGDTDIAKLRTTVLELQTQLTTQHNDAAKREATRVIDEAIAAGKTAIVPIRDHYIERHMKDPAGVEKELGAMVSLHSGRVVVPPKDKNDPASGLTSDQIELCSQMGLTTEQFIASRKSLGMENI
ncbi:phage protease [Ancylobacter defluvii]|uniref:Mu-like prophage I protein n=1 Tax=Ancylobacter defluvii TaxID=1282440 RepID=A0A9W6K0E3_9HYPH|nr:phage protease [Ancylobacter defluvii]MBS7586413.1 hypothetical protein [Ancylobacter defluvii]GLK85694.1 hypothetical protein GCM10017653_37640 [Ancylobacter defluvii]